MEQKTLSKWLKWIIIGIAVCGVVVYAAVVPMLGQTIVWENPECANYYIPWLIFLWMTAIPCYIALIFGWKIATNIGQDRSFSEYNAKMLKWISGLAIGDAVFFFAGNIVLLFLNMNHPGIVLGSLIVVFAGVAIAVAAAALSHLVKKAAVLQDQSDWTI